MAQGHAALLDLHQHIPGEHIRHQAAFAVLLHHAVGIDADAAAILTAMLEGVERVVGFRHHALALPAINAEHAAFIMGLVHLLVHRVGVKPELVFHHFLILFTF